MRYMVTKIAFGGSPTDEVHFIDDKLTYQGIEKKKTRLHLEVFKWSYINTRYPHCTMNLSNYLKKRGTQWKRRGMSLL